MRFDAGDRCKPESTAFVELFQISQGYEGTPP